MFVFTLLVAGVLLSDCLCGTCRWENDLLWNFSKEPRGSSMLRKQKTSVEEGMRLRV